MSRIVWRSSVRIACARAADYQPPVVRPLNTSVFSTNGTTTFVIEGSNLGPPPSSPAWTALNASVRVWYGVYSVTCSVTTDSAAVTCVAVVGMGSQLPMVLGVGSQNASVPGTVAYRVPEITSMRPLNVGGASVMPTQGCLVRGERWARDGGWGGLGRGWLGWGVCSCEWKRCVSDGLRPRSLCVNQSTLACPLMQNVGVHCRCLTCSLAVRNSAESLGLWLSLPINLELVRMYVWG